MVELIFLNLTTVKPHNLTTVKPYNLTTVKPLHNRQLTMGKDELKAALTDRIEKGKALGLLTLPTRDDMAGCSDHYVGQVALELKVKKRKYVDEFSKWSAYNVELLKRAFGSPDNEYLKQYESAGRTTYVFTRISDFVKIYQREITGKISYLESLVERMPLLPEIEEKQPVMGIENCKDSIMETMNRKDSHRIFIVHGHDSDLRTQVENLVRQLNYDPIVLFMRPSMGGTIIEKIEREAGDVAFAIVLYTACDWGNDKERVHDITDLNSRARQNVVFEHGYMCALLGRSRVCAVVEQGVEIPGDLSGIVYVPYDDKGKWRFDIVREMRAVGLDADANNLV